MIVLETERLVFRDHRPEDLEPFCLLEADPYVRRFVGGKPRAREAAERKFRQSLSKSGASRLRLWATILKEDGRYIGYCGIYPYFRPAGPPVPREGSLGFTLTREYWNRGLGTEAARAFVEFGFNELRLRRIVASVEVGNGASVHILEKLGFSLWRLERVGLRSFYHLELRSPAHSRGEARRGRKPSGQGTADAAMLATRKSSRETPNG
jgi:RimJ/RimL family protein N-acetyltransferase